MIGLSPNPAALMSDHGPETLFNAHLQLAARIGQSFPIQGLSLEESTHEARIALWQAANAFDPTRGTFEAFASIVIRNHLRNAFGKAKRASVETTSLDVENSSTVEDGATTEKESIPAAEADPLLEAERADIRTVLRQSLAELTPAQKELLERFAAGESFAEIGREKGVSSAAIRQMALRAAERVRPDLESKSIDVRFFPQRHTEEDDSRQPPITFLSRPRPAQASPSLTVGCLALALVLGVAVTLVRALLGSLGMGH